MIKSTSLFCSFLFTLLVSGPMALAQSSSVKAPAARKPAQTAAAQVSTNAPATRQVLENKSASVYAFTAPANSTILETRYETRRSDTTVNLKSQNFKSQSSGTAELNLVHLKMTRGLANGFNASAETAIGSEKYSPTGDKNTESSGMTDWTLKLQTVNDLSASKQVFFGAKAVLSPGVRESGYAYEDSTSARSSTGNMYSGGNTYGGFVGVQSNTRQGVIGTKASLDFVGDKQGTSRTNNGSKIYTDSTGGNLLGVEGFAELTQNSQMTIGVLAGLTSVQETTNTLRVAGKKESFSTDQTMVLGLAAYGKFSINKTVDVLPEFRSQQLMNGGGGTAELKTFQENKFILNARMTL
jgi:hypothetical protein